MGWPAQAKWPHAADRFANNPRGATDAGENDGARGPLYVKKPPAEGAPFRAEGGGTSQKYGKLGTGKARPKRTGAPFERARHPPAVSSLFDPCFGRPSKNEPHADYAKEQDQHRRRLRHVVRRGRRRALRIGFRIARWLAGRSGNDRRDDIAREFKGRDIGRRPFRHLRRKYRLVGRHGRRHERRRFGSPPWFPRRRGISGEPFRNGAGS